MAPEVKLNKGEIVQLFLGNSGASNQASQGFQYAYPGDYISIKLVSH